MKPHFCPATAPDTRHNILVRWPGPFGSGFLSPQPPGVVGIGPIHNSKTKGQRKLVLLLFRYRFLHSTPERRALNRQRRRQADQKTE